MIRTAPKKPNEVQLKHPNASGSHATFIPNGVIDTSSNGTYIIHRGTSGLSEIKNFS
jgi:hypothetical protein